MQKSYLEEIKQFNIRKSTPTKGRTALLVIDMQYTFREPAQSILSNINEIIEACKLSGSKIFFTRHGYRNPAEEAGVMRLWWGVLTQYGSPEWELLQELEAERNGTIIDKTRYNAFHGTDLHAHLRRSGVKDIIICGVLTNCCCETTAREAFVRDYRVFFVSDATNTVNEELHLASLKNLAYGFAYVVSTEDTCRALKEHLGDKEKR